MTGYAQKKRGIKMISRSAELCTLYPLNAWLWQTLCFTPTVLLQLSRCLMASELANYLRALIYGLELVYNH